jgi:hypothetical protein
LLRLTGGKPGWTLDPVSLSLSARLSARRSGLCYASPAANQGRPWTLFRYLYPLVISARRSGLCYASPAATKGNRSELSAALRPLLYIFSPLLEDLHVAFCRAG